MAITKDIVLQVKNATPDKQNQWLKMMNDNIDSLSGQDKADYEYIKSKLRPDPDDDTEEFLTSADGLDVVKHLGRGFLAASDEEKATAIANNSDKYHSPSKIEGRWYVYEKQANGTSKPIAINKEGLSWQDLATGVTEVASFLPAFRIPRVLSALNKVRRASNIAKNEKLAMDIANTEGIKNMLGSMVRNPGATAKTVLGNTAPVVGVPALATGTGIDLARQLGSQAMGYRDDIDPTRSLATGVGAAIPPVVGRYGAGVKALAQGNWRGALPAMQNQREGLMGRILPLDDKLNVGALVNPLDNLQDSMSVGLGSLGGLLSDMTPPTKPWE